MHSEVPEWQRQIKELMQNAREHGRSSDPAAIQRVLMAAREKLRGRVRFPRDRETYEASEDVSVHYMIMWTGPYSDTQVGDVSRGTRVQVSVPSHEPEPLVVNATIVGDDAEDRVNALLPQAFRTDPKFGSFYLQIDIEQFNRSFVLVHG